MSDAFTAGLTVKRGDGAGTEVFTAISEVTALGGLGVNNDQIEVTNFDSAGSKEYIGGLADGTELTIECNFLPADVAQQALIGDVDSKTTRNIQITITDGTTPKTYTFATAPLKWEIVPAVDSQNKLNFTLKISGTITVT